MNRLVPVLWLMCAAVIIGASLGFSARANADGYCTTDHYSNATYTICTWTDSTGYSHRTVETCLDGANTCSIKGN